MCFALHRHSFSGAESESWLSAQGRKTKTGDILPTAEHHFDLTEVLDHRRDNEGKCEYQVDVTPIN